MRRVPYAHLSHQQKNSKDPCTLQPPIHLHTSRTSVGPSDQCSWGRFDSLAPPKPRALPIYHPSCSNRTCRKQKNTICKRATKRPPFMLIAVFSPEQRLLSHVCVCVLCTKRFQTETKRKELSTSSSTPTTIIHLSFSFSPTLSPQAINIVMPSHNIPIPKPINPTTHHTQPAAAI